MNHTGIKKTAVSGLLWKMSETILVNGTQALIYLILARLLMPEDFGVVALVGAFIAISNVFVNSGLGSALIQSKQADEIDYATVLYFSLFISCVLYLLFFVAAPFIAEFYKEPVIESVLRIYSISIIFAAVNGVQKSILLRELKFKKVSLVGSITVIFSGVISVSMALSGYGIYALVFNSVFLGLISTVAFFVTMKWLPKLTFSIDRLRVLFKFSYKLLLTNLIEAGYTSIFPLLIGKSFNSEALGYYNNGRQLPGLVANSINASITSVTFTVYSRYQSDIYKLKLLVRQSIVVSNFIILPSMTLLAATAEPLVVLMLTEKWLPSVPYLQLFCVVYGLHHQHNISFQAIAAIGRSDVFLKYQIIKKVIGLTMLMVTLQFGLVHIVMGQVFTAAISIIISIRPNRMLLNYSFVEQLVDFLPYLFITILMYFGVYLVGLLGYGVWMTLISQGLVGVCLYIALALSFKLRGVGYISGIINTYFGGRFRSSR